MVALPINLQNLLRHRTVESERIEYKAAWNPDAVIRTLCAFANDFENQGGGYIIVGQDCDASGRPIVPPHGLEENQIDKIQRELLAACQQIRPPYFPGLSVCEVDDRIAQQAKYSRGRWRKLPAKRWAISSATSCTRRY